MRVVIQRVSEASVKVDNEIKGKINGGLMILLGIENRDEEKAQEETEWLCNKIVNLRIFDDEKGVMNKSIMDVKGDILLISQFTLHASTKKGNRPSYIHAAKPTISEVIYEQFGEKLAEKLGRPIQTGIFGADMDVQLINKGPVTIVIDSLNRE